MTLFLVTLTSARGEVTLIGTALIPGNQPDLATALGPDGHATAHRLGGFSAIEYTGRGHRDLVAPDRGPSDGHSDFICRFHELELTVSPGQQPAVVAQVVQTTLLTDESGKQFVGTSSAIDPQRPDGGLRLDPEGLRIHEARLFLSDEYGPHLFEFDLQGRRVGRITLPSHLAIGQPAAEPEQELRNNRAGRVPNRGLEGLAVTADGRRLYAAMQGPLIQDAVLAKKGRLYGRHTRLLEVDLTSGKTREFAFPLEALVNGISEILDVGQNELLAIERDGEAGAKAECKKVWRLDLTGATDISHLNALPPDRLPAGVVPVAKRPFLDLLDPKFGLAGSEMPKKFEGLAWGPRLPDGRLLLVMVVDNDFDPRVPNRILAFGIDAEDLPKLAWKR